MLLYDTVKSFTVAIFVRKFNGCYREVLIYICNWNLTWMFYLAVINKSRQNQKEYEYEKVKHQHPFPSEIMK